MYFGKCVNIWRTESVRCFSESVICNHRGPVWRADTTLATRIRSTRFPSDMAGNNIQPMDISGSKSELSERWRVWLRGFKYFYEGKANLQNPARRRSELLYWAGSGVQDIFENLTTLEGQADDVYQQNIRSFNAYFHVQENAAYERHVLRQLHQEPGEDVDSLLLRLRNQARHCGYGVKELEFAVRDQLLEKVSSQELRTKLFEVSNIQLAEALTTARAWEIARRQANKIAEERKRAA